MKHVPKQNSRSEYTFFKLWGKSDKAVIFIFFSFGLASFKNKKFIRQKLGADNWGDTDSKFLEN